MPVADSPAQRRGTFEDERAFQIRTTPTVLLLVVALYFVLVLNTAFWGLVLSNLDWKSSSSPLLIVQMGLFLFGLIVVVFSLVRFPYVLKPVLAVLLVASAAAAYFMNQYGILIDDDMLRNALQTDNAETAGLLNWTLAAYIAILGLLPALIVIRTKLRWSGIVRNGMQSVAVLALGLVIALGGVFADFKASAPFVRAHGKQMRWRATPLNLVQASLRVAREQRLLANPTPYTVIAKSVKIMAKKLKASNNLVVLVVGETARSMNFSINGYGRQTTPQLEQLPVVSFSTVASCGTATAISLPCMFSDLDRKQYSGSKVENRENLLDLAGRAGYRVLWIDNQAGSKGVADRVEFQQLERITTEGPETPDADFIPAFRRLLNQAAEPTLVVLHQMGSHGPEYFKRSRASTKPFLPECRDNRLERCSAQEILNAYDNTIVETDNLIAGLIKEAMKQNDDRPITILYVSDHGESLGENGLYLHGMPYVLAPVEQTAVPMIYWANKAAATFSDMRPACISSQRDRPLSHDNYFDTVLGILRIESDVYQANRDALAQCRRATSAPAVNDSWVDGRPTFHSIMKSAHHAD